MSSQPQYPARPGLLRALNDRTITDLLLGNGPLTRSRLAQLSQLSKPTTSESLSRLIASGVVAEAGEVSGAHGPSAQSYAVDPLRFCAAGVDVTPTGARMRVVDASGRELGESVLTRLPGRTPTETVQELLAMALPPGAKLAALVVAVPGVYDAEADAVRLADRVREWTKVGLAADLRVGIGSKVRIENNVNLAAVAERRAGVGAHRQGFALLWIDDGLGLALDTEGSLHRGATGSAGEIGYMPVWNGPRQGRATDLQDLIGGVAVRALARSAGVPGKTAATVVRRAVAEQNAPFLDELAQRVAHGIAVIAAVADPAIVVLGGSVGAAGGAVLADRVERAVTASSRLTVHVAATAVADEPVLTGARHLAADLARSHLLDSLAPLPDSAGAHAR